MFRKPFLLSFLLPLALAASAQDIHLPNRFVLDLDVDGDNLIWVATENGLSCFDGISTRTFRKQEGGLSASVVNGVCADREEPLVWAALQKGGLACYDKRTEQFRLYRQGEGPEGLSNDDITHLEQGPDGDIWASTFTAGIDRLDRESGEFTHYNAGDFPGYRDAPLHVFKLRGDQLVLGYWASGVSILSLTDHSRIDLRNEPGNPASLPSDEVRSLLVDSQNRIWVGTSRGLALYSEAGHDFMVFRQVPGDPGSLPEEEIFDLQEDEHGRLVVATASRGVVSLDIGAPGAVPADARFTPLVRAAGPGQPQIRSLAFDRFDNLWIGSYGNGLGFRSAAERGTGQIRLPQGFEYNGVSSLLAARDGSLVAATQAGCVTFGAGIPSGSARLEGFGAPVQALLEDARGRRWVGTADGRLYVREDGGTRRVALPPECGLVRALLEDGPKIWVGTERGVFRFDQDALREEVHLTRAEWLPDNIVRALLKDRAGRLWVGTYGHGVGVFDADLHSVAHFEAASGLLSDTVNDLLEDSRGRIWVATSEGLVRFDEGPERISAVYTSPADLPDNDIRALAEDAAGNLWMGTGEGVCCLTADGRRLSFDRRNQLPDGNYSAAAAARSPDGRILFGTTSGIAWVRPSKLLSAQDLPAVVFRTPEKDLTVSWRDNYLRLRFTLPDYAWAGSVHYSYRIADLDPAWHPCERELEFNHLPYGRHNLQVRAFVDPQAWDGTSASATLTVLPPFWRTWWAKVLYGLLALAFIAAVILQVKRKMAKEGEERLQRERLLQERRAGEERLVFYTNITHELRTPLTLILGPLEDLSADGNLPASARGRIGKVTQSARQLLGLVNQLLEFRKTETRNRRLTVSYGDLSRFVEETGSRFRDLNVDKSVSFQLAVEPDIRLWFDPEALTIILNNLLSNARKFTPSGKVVLSLQREDGRVALKVSDTGVGIAPEDLAHNFDRYYRADGTGEAIGTGIGLALVKNLCDLHRIALSVASEPGRGTEFSLLLDPQEDYPEALRVGPVPEEVPAEETAEPQDPGRVRVLVVEDNAEIREYIRESLEPEYGVLQAADGREGLKVAVRELPDIIVSDIMMPVMDGIAFCKAIRQDVRTSHIPVVLLTAKGTDESRTEGYQVGADSYLVKPFNKTLLLSRIRNLLERQKRTRLQVSESGATEELSPVDNEFLARYTQYVEEHLGDERIDIVSLAGEFAMSQSTLYRKVKAVSGLSPNELIRNIRLNKAAQMLRKTQLPISEISWQTGFGSPVYFRTCFKERFGVTPTEYREQ